MTTLSSSSGRRLRGVHTTMLVLALWLMQVVALGTHSSAAATPLNVFVGYMDTHSVASSSNQPTPWPYTSPTSYLGSPCPNFGNDTTCWDASAVRLDNPGSADVTGVHPVVSMGSSSYDLWGTVTVRAHSTLVLTETGGQNSANVDGSDFSPNAYNGGNLASCTNSGAIPVVQLSIAGVTTKYLDSGQVLNGGGVDSGHCLTGSFVTGRMDESHPWVQIGTGTATAPSPPQSVAATAGSGSVSLSWAIPVTDGGSNITGYNVYRGTAPAGEGTVPIGTTSGLAYTDNTPANGTTYFYTVAAVNGAGTSAPSNEVSATPKTVQATVPSAPRSLSGSAGSSSVQLNWVAPTSTGGSPINGYNVYRGPSAGGESSTPLATNLTTTSFTDLSAVNGTAYFYTVAAVNSVGVSPFSNEVAATPLATVPSSPRTLVASGASGSVALSWTAPATDGGAGITGYSVYRATAAGAEGAVPIATGVGLTSFTDSGLANGTTYFYKVAAVNAVGTSPPSNEASATPTQAATVASAPPTLTSQAGNASISLAWTVPGSDGGAAITGYSIYRGLAANAEASAPIATNISATTFVNTGLTNGTAYFYKVVAVNAVGTSAPSPETSATPAATAPAAPQSVVTTPGNSAATVAWSAPASDGGSPVTGYNVYRGTAANAEASTPIATGVIATSYTDSGLVNGRTYFYKVAAVNAVATSVLSAESSTTPQAPAATSYVRRIGSAVASSASTSTTVGVGSAGVSAGHTIVVSALLSSTSTSATVSATDSAANSYLLARDVNDGSAGDRVITLVALNARPVAGGGTITLAHASSGESHVVIDEYAGVTALDTSAGASATASAFSSGLTPVTAQPTELLLGSVGAESGTTPTWSSGWTALPSLAVSSDYLGTAYRLVSSAGAYAATGTSNGQWMASVVALKAGAAPPATAPSAPSAPQSLTAGAGNGTVQLNWSPPASTGGSPVTGYSIYRGTTSNGESGTALASNLTTTSYTDAAVTNGTTYFYRVTALNGVGASPPSIEASATPQAPSGAGFVRTVGSLTASSATTANSVPIGGTPVLAGHTLVVSVLLSSSSASAAISVQDAATNNYVLARDVNDGSSGDRTVVLIAVNARTVAAGTTISVTHGSAAETQLRIDEYTGVSAIDTTAAATATATAFSSGNTATTNQAGEILIGVVGIESGKTPTWSAGWTALPAVAVSTDYLGGAYRVVSAIGAYAATGSGGGQWMAAILTLR